MLMRTLWVIIMMFALNAAAQTPQNNDKKPFKGYYYNKEYDVYLQLDLYGSTVMVPGQAIFGQVPGYFGDNQDSRKWLITDAKIKGKQRAETSIINDYGSEDLKATLEMANDSTLILKQGEGSNMKIARKRKWVVLPGKLEFIRR